MKPDCRETLKRAYLFLDNEVLSEAERVEISTHLEACRPCLERYGLEGEVSALVARLKGADPCPDRVRARIKNLIQEQ
ncbi:MAG: mycothiol system anti-sigma-R factor [Actinomycetota bacterium]|nr:mycothiol system anti-sigma-R factor [Actinomycetota bacterium]